MKQLDAKNLESVNQIKRAFLLKLIVISASIALLFAVYFTLLLKLPIVGVIELGFAIVFLAHWRILKKDFASFTTISNSWLGHVTLLLTITSTVAEGMIAPGVFWLPAIVYSASVLLEKKATLIWISVTSGILVLMFVLHLAGIKYPNFQNEKGRFNSHFMNVIMILAYTGSFALLSIRLRALVNELNHKILSDLYNENRLKSISQVVGGVGHEINNPLAIGFVSLRLISKSSTISTKIKSFKNC